MKLILDGRRIRDIGSFSAELARAVALNVGCVAEFGWGDLHSLQDRLHGGFGGNPPYDIIVEHAEQMVSEMGHAGLVKFCDLMLATIESGGRGFVQAESREFYETAKAAAQKRRGDTLLDMLREVIDHSPASLTLITSSGKAM